MKRLLDRLGAVSEPPLWLYPLVMAATVCVFIATLPFGLDKPPDVFLEGSFFVLTVLVVAVVRRLDAPLLEWGCLVFLTGRLVDFLDEVFVEPEPIVEPYVSGLVMVLSLVVIVAGVYSLLADRQERIDALQERTAELQLKNRAIDEAPVGITIADMTQEDEPLVYVNEGFTRLTGYDIDRAVGSNCRFLQGEDTDPETVAEMRRAIDAGEPTQVVARNYRKDGTPMWNEVTLAPIDDEDGEPTHYVGFQRDVTERTEYKQRLEAQRDDLELLTRMVRHDIRNDLQVVLANARLLQQDPDDREARLDRIEGSARDAAAVTETARDLSDAILDGEPELTAVALDRTLEAAIAEARAIDDDAVITVAGTLPDINVEADEMLDSVFRNLLKNAVQHNDKDVPEVTVAVTRTGDSVSVSVGDNGPGIPDDRKAAIFDDGVAGEDSDGSGIGTSLVERLVDRYGGTVSVRDNDPEGAVFTVDLPVASSPIS